MILLLAAMDAPESFAANAGVGHAKTNGDTVSRLIERRAAAAADAAAILRSLG